MNSRRNFIVAIGAGMLHTPLGSFAQQKSKIWRIGYIAAGSAPSMLESGNTGAFLRGMRDLGYVEGKNLVVEWRFADGKYEQLPGFAAELVKLKVDIIVAAPSPAIRAAQLATKTIPIVMASTGDPVGAGFVASLARPGGNTTGLSNLGGELSIKLLELLTAMVPRLLRVAVLGNPGSTTHSAHIKNVMTAAKRTNVQVVSVHARTPEEIERGFSAMPREHVDGVIIATDALMVNQRKQIAELAAKYRLPSIHGSSMYAEAGGLMSYSQNILANYQRAATYVDKILKGEKPADLPVEQPMRFELVINGKTAKALGLTIPQELLIMADKLL